MKVNPDFRLGFWVAVGVMSGLVAFRVAERLIARTARSAASEVLS